MPEKPRIFVSYSARANEAGAKPDADRAKSLVEDLEAMGFDPWWDQEGLELNKVWNDEISSALATCHGAVTLLSPVAIESEYVRHEVGYLSIRRRTEPDFPLCSFLCDSLEVGQIGSFFEAIQFSDFQFEGWETEQRSEKLSKALSPAFDLARIPLSATEALESALAGQKHFGAIPFGDLRGAAQRLRWDKESDWQIDRAVHRLFVRHLLSLPIDAQLEALFELEIHLGTQRVIELFEYIAPFWIDTRAADQFRQGIEADPGQRAVIVNAAMAEFTPQMFARRWQAHKPWRPDLFMIDSHAASGRDGGVGALARRSILQRLGLDEQATKEEIRNELKALKARKKICSVICDARVEDLETLAELQGVFREVVFMALTGNHTVAIPDALTGRCTVVKPPLVTEPTAQRHHESNAHSAYQDARDDLGIGPEEVSR